MHKIRLVKGLMHLIETVSIPSSDRSKATKHNKQYLSKTPYIENPVPMKNQHTKDYYYFYHTSSSR